MQDFFHPPYYYGNKMGRISDITSDIFRMGNTTGYIATGLLLLLLRIILRGIHTTDISNPVVCEISPHIFTYINMWFLIKIPLSASGHSLRINMLLSRIFRELHVYLSQSKLFTRTFGSITMYYIHISYGLLVSIICIYIYMWINIYIYNDTWVVCNNTVMTMRYT